MKRTVWMRLASAFCFAMAFAVTAITILWKSDPSDGWLTVDDGEVAVVEELWSGGTQSVLQPGFQLELPYWRSVQRFDRKPIAYTMAGNERKGDRLVPRLVVRAPDGSSYWFPRVELQCTIDPQQLDRLLQDAGPEAAARKKLIDLYARPILRAELGRLSAEEVVAADTRAQAVRRARERLTEQLGQHGLLLLELSVSAPAFAKAYETTIERREVAERDTEALEQKIAELQASTPQVLQQLRAKQDLTQAQLEAQLDRQLEKAERQAVLSRSQADRDIINLGRSVDLKIEELQREADALLVEAQEQAGAFAAQVEAVASLGDSAVRSAWIDALARVPIQVAPRPNKTFNLPEDL